jgi:hypothetical protein
MARVRNGLATPGMQKWFPEAKAKRAMLFGLNIKRSV